MPTPPSWRADPGPALVRAGQTTPDRLDMRRLLAQFLAEYTTVPILARQTRSDRHSGFCLRREGESGRDHLRETALLPRPANRHPRRAGTCRRCRGTRECRTCGFNRVMMALVERALAQRSLCDLFKEMLVVDAWKPEWERWTARYRPCQPCRWTGRQHQADRISVRAPSS